MNTHFADSICLVHCSETSGWVSLHFPISAMGMQEKASPLSLRKNIGTPLVSWPTECTRPVGMVTLSHVVSEVWPWISAHCLQEPQGSVTQTAGLALKGTGDRPGRVKGPLGFSCEVLWKSILNLLKLLKFLKWSSCPWLLALAMLGNKLEIPLNCQTIGKFIQPY